MLKHSDYFCFSFCFPEEKKINLHFAEHQQCKQKYKMLQGSKKLWRNRFSNSICIGLSENFLKSCLLETAALLCGEKLGGGLRLGQDSGWSGLWLCSGLSNARISRRTRRGQCAVERLHEALPPHRTIIFCNRHPGWPEPVLAGREVEEDRLFSCWSPGGHGSGVVPLYSRKTCRRAWVCAGGICEVVIPNHTSGASKTPKQTAARGIHAWKLRKVG